MNVRTFLFGAFSLALTTAVVGYGASLWIASSPARAMGADGLQRRSTVFTLADAEDDCFNQARACSGGCGSTNDCSDTSKFDAAGAGACVEQHHACSFGCNDTYHACMENARTHQAPPTPPPLQQNENNFEEQQRQWQAQQELQNQQPPTHPSPEPLPAPGAAPATQPTQIAQPETLPPEANCAGALSNDTAYHTCLANKTALGQGFSADATTPAHTTFTAPANKSVAVDLPSGGEARLKAGTSIEYSGDNIWNINRGIVQVVEDVTKSVLTKGLTKTREDYLYQKRMEWRRKHGPMTVAVAPRGTNYLIDASSEAATIVKVIAGSVDVSIQETKKHLTLKAGQMATVTEKGIGKATSFNPKKLDKWYENVQPGPAFFANSFLVASSTQTFKRDCETDLSPLEIGTQSLTSEERQYIKTYNDATHYVAFHEIDTFDANAHLVYSRLEKDGGKGKRSAEVYGDGTNIYLRPTGSKTWEKFSDPVMAQALALSAQRENITAHFNPDFRFSMWLDIPRKAIFEGQYAQDATSGILQQATGLAFTADQITQRHTELFVNEATQQWEGYRVDFSAHNKLDFGGFKSCRLSYGKDANLKLPKAKTVSTNVGEKDLIAALQALE